MKNVMVDIETMGTTATAPIVSIGAVKFDATGCTDTFYRAVDLESALREGAVAESGTIMWWLTQDEKAREALSMNPESISTTLTEFVVWSNEHAIWGNGASFDNMIITSAYQRIYGTEPWPFWKDRCYRTIKSCFRDAPKPKREGTYHNALHDAIFQAEHLIEINRFYKLGIL